MKKKQKFYVVWSGHQTGVFDTWDDCQKQIKGFVGAKYKSFDTLEEAKAAEKGHYYEYIKKNKDFQTHIISPKSVDIIQDSLAVDAACSGNPGVLEYQGVRTSDKQRVFYKKFPIGTNNIGEFLALVHGLSYLKKYNLSQPIYSDSRNGIAWVMQKKCKTKLPRTPETEELFKIVERAELWLKNNTWTTKIIKWDTEHCGEIPADFNRKH